MPADKISQEPKENYLDASLLKLIRLAFICLVGFGFLAGLALGTLKWWLIALMFAVEIAGILLTDRYLREVGNWLSGMRGELKVSAVLQTLWWRGFRSVDDINVPNRGNVDHVIVGPTGIWVIETKHWVGQFGKWNNKIIRFGKPYGRDPIKQAYAESRAIQDYLVSKGFNFTTRPVLCFSADFAKLRLGEKPVAGVQVVGYRWLPKLIDNPGLAGTLDEKQIEAIYKELLALKK